MASSTDPPLISFLLLILILALSPLSEADPYVGFNIASSSSNFPSPVDLITFLKKQNIQHIRIPDSNTTLLRALAGTGISVIIGIPNNHLPAFNTSSSTAPAWVSKNILPFYPETSISAVAVGDDLLSAVPSSSEWLLSVLNSIHASLLSVNITSIKISTPHSSSSLILDPFPPSQAFFNHSMAPAISSLLSFLSLTSSPLMLNLYPYYVFMDNRAVVPLDNCLFLPLLPSKEMVDSNTLLHYTNLLDAMLDAAYFSMSKMNVSQVGVVVTETGWPWRGAGQQENKYATVVNADTYNSNLIMHVYGRKGTPLRPEVTPSVYIYELLTEGGGGEEEEWGLFEGREMKAVYKMHVEGSGGFMAADTTNQTYCVVEGGGGGREKEEVQAALDWACGQGKADCSEIQAGKRCYQPNNVWSHASYAFDSYYQKQGRGSEACDFNGVAIITTDDPSHGDCIFPGSQKVGNGNSQKAKGNNITHKTSAAHNNNNIVTYYNNAPPTIFFFFLFFHLFPFNLFIFF